jgi:YVTN family beta-propeller protein
MAIGTLAPGEVFAGYRIEGVVGRGGMGVVYRATDLALDRPVALKVVAPELAEDARFRERFLRESRLAASLEHPHVLPVHAAGEQDGTLFLVMRFVEGEDLKARLAREGRLEPATAIALVGQIADALDAAHAKGLVHRDVKPGNVLIAAGGEAYLCDFGLSKPMAAERSLTDGGQLVGTLDYLAPEQIRGSDVDGGADQYALGCVLYECLAGGAPFEGSAAMAVMWAHMHERPVPVRERRPELPPEIDAVLRKALAKEPSDRYEDCSALAVAAGSALGLGVETIRAPLLPAWTRRHARLIVLAGALLVAGAVAAAVVQLTGGSGSDAIAVVAGDTVAVVDAGSNRVTSQIPVGRRPTSIAVGEDAVWVINADDKTISRIDPATQEERRFATGTTPSDLAVGEGAVWVSSGDEPQQPPDTVTRVDPDTGAVVGQPTALPAARPVAPLTGVTSGGTSMAVGEGAVWAIDPDGSVSRIDPSSGDVVATVQRLSGNTIAVGEGAVWVVNTDSTVARIDPTTNQVDMTIDVAAESLSAIAVGAGAVWVTDPIGGAVWRIDPGGARVVLKTIDLEFGVVGIAFGEGSVWVANAIEGTVQRIDPGTDRVVDTVHTGNAPLNLAVGEGSVWVTVGEQGVAAPPVTSSTTSAISPLSDTFCGPPEGPADARLLITSDLPLQGGSQDRALAIEAAIRRVLADHDFKAGKHTLAYQSCDDSTAQAGGFEVEKCAANAKAYADNRSVAAVIGAYNSGCSAAEIPFANRAPDGPLAMLSPSNSDTGLTRESPSAPRGNLARLYPTGVRNFLRVYPPDDAQAAALAELARDVGLRRVFVLEDASPGGYAYDFAELFEQAAGGLGVEIAGRRRWDAQAESYRVLAQQVAAANPDAVLLSGYVYSNAGRLVEDLRTALGPDVPLLAPDGFSRMADLLQIVGPAARGMYVSVQGVPTDRLSPEGLTLVQELRTANPDLNDYWAAYGAQAAEVLLDAIARSDGTRSSVLEALFATEVEDGIIGSFGFDANGDTTSASISILRPDGEGPGMSHLSEDFAEGSTVDRVISPDLALVRP